MQMAVISASCTSRCAPAIARVGDSLGQWLRPIEKVGSIRQILSMHTVKELLQFLPIEFSVGPNTRAEIESEWLHSVNRFTNVLRIQSPREKNRLAASLNYLSAQAPIVPAACTPKLLSSELRITAVEEDRIDVLGNFASLIDRS